MFIFKFLDEVLQIIFYSLLLFTVKYYKNNYNKYRFSLVLASYIVTVYSEITP